MRNTSDLEVAGARNDSLSERDRSPNLPVAANRLRRQIAGTITAREKADGPIPLSYAQERLWFLDQLGLVGAAYNVPMALRLEGSLNVGALEHSFAELVRRHESLRTRFEVRDGVPHQLIDPPGHFELHRADLSHVADPKQREQQLSEWVQREQLHRFDLCEGPPLRVVLGRLGAHEHVLLLTMHHIVSDGWSLGVLHRELGALYGAYSQGQPSPLPELPVQYADYAIWQRAWLQGEVLQSQLRFWTERLLGAPPQLELPTDRPRPAVESFKGAQLRFELPAALYGALKELGRREGSTLFMVSLAAYQVLLSRWSGQRDIVVGSPIAGRGNRQVEGLIGFFVNMLALRTDVSGDLTFRQMLARVNEMTLEAYAHVDLPFEALVKELRPERNLTRQPIIQVALALQKFPQERLELSGLTGTWSGTDRMTTHFDLTLYLYEASDHISGVFEYATDLFDEGTVCRMAGNFRTLLEAIVANPDCSIQKLQLLSDVDRKLVLHEFNDTAVSHSEDQLLHELFEAQVERTPELVAVICGDRQLTYSQLNRRANQLARALLARGVRPNERVGVYAERSVEMVIALLGILKAGGAYVPLDVSYPAERLAYMLGDSAPIVLLTQERLKGALEASDARVMSLDANEDEFGCEPDGNLDAAQLGLKPQDLVYVIYTSGSTGTPKGVMVTHRNVLNLVHWHCAAFNLSEGCRCSCVAAVGFDAAAWEIWPPLSVGATLVLASSKETGDVEALLAWWASRPLDVGFLPTPVAELAFSRNIRNATLRTLLVGGDRLRFRPVSSSFSLINNYGPTESTVVATSGCIHEEDVVLHIGRPISNTQTYILDDNLQPVPIGVPGEIYIGGASVARGYLNRPDLTAERFIADPFSAHPQTRMYKTGDLGRWCTEGNIEYLGRNDHQVKIRGYRIELGEIEGQLARHAQVKETVVVVREDVPGEKRLVAYVVGDRNAAPEAASGGISEQLRNEVVSEWETLYEETYGAQNHLGPSFVGWNSSYTGQPIPETQMEEWLACTVDRIRALRPTKVLEIGCGVGLLLQHVAPECTVYVGTDFSAAAVAQLRQWVSRREDLKHVELLHRSATELEDLQSCSFDTVVLNAVVQCFPDIDYLLAVLKDAIRLLGPGGRIFLGDVRHFGLLSMFHSAVQLSKAAATVSVGQLRRRIARAVAQEKELVIDPLFFQVLPAHLPGISSAEVHLKRGRARDEVTRYRYDVVLHTGDEIAARVVCEPLEWQTAVGSAAQLEAMFRVRRLCAVRLHSIPNPRLTREAAAQRLIETSDERLEVGVLRRQLNEMQFEEIDPETCWELGQAHGYDVQVGPGEQGYFEVQLLDRAQADQVPRVVSPPDKVKSWSAYANDPLENGFRQQLIPQLREYLKLQVPEYMIPSAWLVLKQLPLTPNGKLDRRALPAPQSNGEELGEYIAPRTELERTLVDIWTQLLRVDQVGVQDNFFDLGGHSLLVLKTLSKINESLGSDLRVADVYKCPTIRELAARISGGTTEDDLIDLSREAALDDGIVAKPGRRCVPAEAVMLTGGTGFVGRFLLAQLLQDTDATIYCLVRAPSQHQAFSRLRATLVKWDLWCDEYQRRIVAIPGDLRLPHLGVDEVTYQVLCHNIDTIYHCAASMNHLETYAMAKSANVDSARGLLKLATHQKPKLINYISTLGVYRPSVTSVTRVADEESPIDREIHSTANGYVASKWVGERILMTAGEKGIPCNIFRLGLVWADTQQGRYDELQREYRIFKSCMLSGFGIENYQYAMVPTPVDYVAQAVVFLANRHVDGQGIFHISSSNQMVEGVFERCNKIANTSLELTPFYDWICRIKRLHHERLSLPIVPLIEFAFSMDEKSFYEQQRRLRSGSIRFDCARTHRELEHAGIVAPVVNDDLLALFLDSMFSRDTELRELTAFKNKLMFARRPPPSVAV